jgi:hypothetical protein
VVPRVIARLRRALPFGLEWAAHELPVLTGEVMAALQKRLWDLNEWRASDDRRIAPLAPA